MRHFLGITMFSLLVIATGHAWASEEDELRERAERQRLEARQVSEAQAARLLKEAESREQKAQQIARENAEREQVKRPGDREREAHAIQEKLENLEKYRKQMGTELAHDHPEIVQTEKLIEKLKTELNELIKQHPQEQRQREEITRKIQHLHGAAGHLEEAGMPDMARELRQQAENLKRELHPHHAGGEEVGEVLRQLMEQMRDMKQEVEKLRNEVAELREQLSRAKR